MSQQSDNTSNTQNLQNRLVLMWLINVCWSRHHFTIISKLWTKLTILRQRFWT